MELNIHISSVDNNPAVCFDTGLDPRSFARTKMSQSLIEQGFVVSADGTHKVWRPSGVNETNGSMRVFGPVFQGKRLDLLLDEVNIYANRQTALEAVVYWIRSKMFLGETRSAYNPGASFISLDNNGINPKGSVFFAPENLSNRCLHMEGTQPDRYNCPDLIGMDTAAFCAAVMLYKIFTGVHPYPSAEIYQDMREGVFMPLHFAAPDLDDKICSLIQAALLLPVAKKRSKNGTDILTELLELLLGAEGSVISLSSLFSKTSAEKKDLIEKEKKLHAIKQNSFIKTKRFVTRNKHLLIGISIGLIFMLFVIFSTMEGFSKRPTTAGMSPDNVVTAYYEAFSSLNHAIMEACVQGADKADINAAASLFAVIRTRQAYEGASSSTLIQARVWKESGGDLPAPNVFGVTDLTIDYLGGNEDQGLMVFRASYHLWAPDESFARNRSDVLTLRRDRRRNWRIIEILRTER